MTMEFFDWSILNTYAGAALAVAYIVEMTKTLPTIINIPTQLWSYLVSLITLLLAMAFDVGFTLQGAGLAVFNAVLVSLASNGGYDVVQRVKNGAGVETIYMKEAIDLDDDGGQE